MKFIRWFVGRLLLALNALFRPRAVVRSKEEQMAIDAATPMLRLYQFEMCPFCIMVRRAMGRLNLKIAVFDVNRSPAHAEDLIAGGGRRKVPCLRITQPDGSEQWMYESNDIIAYLNDRFSYSGAA